MMGKVLMLHGAAFYSGWLSGFLIVATIVSLYMLCDETLHPLNRLWWGCGHGVAHTSCALACLVFVETVVEWTVRTSPANKIFSL